MFKSKIEELICSHEFAYLQPYFYNNPYALRCELGVCDSDEEYIANAKKRALEIYNTLFPAGADAIIFNYWIYDYSDSADAECLSYEEDDDLEGIIDNRVAVETEQLRFLSHNQMKYRHQSVKNLPTYDDFDDVDCSAPRRNRIICFSDGKEFDYNDLIDRQINGTNGHEISFVSFEHECILSIYDDRGCDVVFATCEKMKEFYSKLQPYFLSYDLEEMSKRYNTPN